MGLLGEIFSSGDRMKRKLRGLLDDPMGTIALGSQRMSEDVQQMGLLADESGYLPGTNSVLLTPQQKERARKALADKGAEMGAAMIGTTKFTYPQEKALAEAQRNAAKPVSQGGLGLGPNNTAAERARAMGFDTAPSKATFHGARGEIDGPINPALSDFGFHTGQLPQAEARLRAFAPPTEVFPEGANVLPILKSKYANLLRVNDEGSFHADALAAQLAKKKVVSKDWAKMVEKDVKGNWRNATQHDETIRRAMTDQGYDGIVYSNAQEGAGNSFAFSNPSVLRSRFAAFDPMRRDSPDLLAGALPFGLLYEDDKAKKRKESK